MTPGGGGYEAHLWNGPGTFLRPDPKGGLHLAIDFRRPYLDSLGVHTTAGFFGWSSAGPDVGLLVLPHSAQVTRLDFGHVRHVVAAPGTPALVVVALALCLLQTSSRQKNGSRCRLPRA